MAEVLPEVAPSEADERYEDAEFNPALEPKKANAWLNMLRESEEAFEEYNDACDNIEKAYASLKQLRSIVRDKQFNLFWANLEILKPSIYAKPPVPVVVPKFKDRRPLYQVASEMLERASIVAFDLTRINDLLLLIRDDLAMFNRGVAWCRYEPHDKELQKPEYVCVDHKNRRDFLHSLSRNWREVTWVAAASYMTRGQARKRFYRYSKNIYQDAEYKVDKYAKEISGGDSRERAKFWEVWHKGMNKVVWIAEGCEYVLDEADPKELADLKDFFPCPKPAYSTCQPGSLLPVPDVLQYKDQLDEVNTLTSRLHAIAQALEVKGFYPAGSAELSDAIQAAVATKAPGRVLVPISNWAAFGGSKEVIVWMPIDMIANVITAITAVRKQVIEDIYQTMGLSDIMRGATDPQETLGAQQLKSQYGSVRIRDRQGEMVRIARDLEEISAEIMCSEFSTQTFLDMSQMDIPSDAQQAQKIDGMEQQLQQAVMQLQQQMMMAQQQQLAAPPGGPPAQPGGPPAQPAGPPPGPPPQVLQQLQNMQNEIQQEREKPTVEQVIAFLKDYRTTAFILDIETDSTIQADENAEKQRRTEFVGVLAQLIPQLAQLITADPGTAPFCGEVLKFAVAPFRAGRTLDGAIDDLVDQMEQKAVQAGQNPRPDPETQKLQATTAIEAQKLQAKKMADDQTHQREIIKMQNDRQLEEIKINGDLRLALFEAQSRRDESMAKIQQITAKTQQEAVHHQATMAENQQKMQLNTQTAQQKQMDAQQRRYDMGAKRDLAERNQVFKERQAAMKPLGTPTRQ